MKIFTLHPITRKRLQRFRRVRYAYWSFMCLVLIYGLSLFSELLCNDRPLMIRYEGKTYFPFLKFYPEDTFTGNGRMTRPDYKAINRLAAFAENGSNRMWFAPVPYGPRETLAPSDIETSKNVTVTFKADPSTAVLYLTPEWTVEKLRDSRQPCGLQPGDDFSRRFRMSANLRVALQKRFENEATEAYHEQVEWDGRRFDLKLPPNQERSKPRATARVYLEEDSLSLEPLTWKSTHWKSGDADLALLPAEVVGKLETAAQAAADGNVSNDVAFEIDGIPYVASFSTEQVIFPFRPCKGHALGLDGAGRDVLVLLLYGLRIAFSFGILLVISAMVLGTLIGSMQGYYAGKVDIVVQRLIEIWQAMPFLYILILIGSVFGRGFTLLLLLYGVFNWIGISYYMRAEFLRLRKLPFVEAARCMGVRPTKIMMKHMLPNALVPLITFFPFSLVGAIGVLAALDYLGFGLPAGTPSWGELLSQAQEFRYAWWLILYPSLALFVVMLLGVFIGEGVRTAFDPRTYSRMEG